MEALYSDGDNFGYIIVSTSKKGVKKGRHKKHTYI